MDATISLGGLTIVAEPSKHEEHNVDIIFVHGLCGHPEGTWTWSGPVEQLNASNVQSSSTTNTDRNSRPYKKRRVSPLRSSREVFWPRDLLPDAFPKARVMTWGYKVALDDILKPNSKDSIFHHAGALLSDLALLRHQEADKRRRLIFIAHSLGGIVVKDALSRSKNETTWINEILPAALGVIFLGTPHHGSQAASLGKKMAMLSKIFGLDANTKILRALEKGSESLERITRAFGQVLGSGQVRIHSCQEELKTNGCMIVDTGSSYIGYLHETTGTIHADHRNMCKFSSPTDRGYQQIIAVLQRWFDDVDKPDSRRSTSVIAEIQPRQLPDGLIFDKVFSREWQECVNSLDDPEARARIQNVKAAYGDTYNWLFEDEIGFSKWLAGKDTRPIHWIYGKPGSGKSTLMKYAMGNAQTMSLLQGHDSHPWKIAGFFFHDRGTQVQKSIEGFLREILYQLLRHDEQSGNLDQGQELFTIVYSIYANVKRTQRSQREVQSTKTYWTQDSLQKAIQAIASKTTHPLNLCLFVDALDEHNGNHRELISTLTSLTQFEANCAFRLRLCVAGRPENVFKGAFREYPGFAIHSYTTMDIRHYTEDRIHKENVNLLTDNGEEGLISLVDDIVTKAHGVFLWVRLVVDELIEGLTDGKTFEELRDLLDEIPEELEDLYTRAVCRVHRFTGRALTKQKYEAYVMFQIATCTHKPMSLVNILMAAFFLATDKPACREFRCLSVEQMMSRLNSVSTGLLEVIYQCPKEWYLKDEQRPGWNPEIITSPVQFMHQTAKEFLLAKKGRSLIKEGVRDRPVEGGNLLIFRYVLCQLGALPNCDLHGHSGDLPLKRAFDHVSHMETWLLYHAYSFALTNFLTYAHELEFRDKLYAADYIEQVTFLSPSKKDDNIFIRVIRQNFQKKWAKIFSSDLHEQPEVQLLLFYTLCDLPLSFSKILKAQNRIWEEEGIAFLLIRAAVFRDDHPHFQPQTSSIFEGLLDLGVGAALTQAEHRSLLAIWDYRSGSTTNGLEPFKQLFERLKKEEKNRPVCKYDLGKSGPNWFASG